MRRPVNCIASLVGLVFLYASGAFTSYPSARRNVAVHRTAEGKCVGNCLQPDGSWKPTGEIDIQDTAKTYVSFGTCHLKLPKIDLSSWELHRRADAKIQRAALALFIGSDDLSYKVISLSVVFQGGRMAMPMVSMQYVENIMDDLSSNA
eukprot:symbB.v1.2.000724.t1/scaffold29.1/size409896/4